MITFLQELIIWAVPVLFAITVHEVSHGFVAYLCGDTTAQRAGRLTLDPLRHIDLVGTILVPALMLMFGGILFGWAKPVPVNWFNLRRPKRDMALVAMAGPFANFVMAVIWVLIAKAAIVFLDTHTGPGAALVYMGKAGVMINLLLMLFNVLPLPPLDGSRVVTALLPERLAWEYNRLEPFGFFILLALIAVGVIGYVVWPPLIYLQTLLFNLVHI